MSQPYVYLELPAPKAQKYQKDEEKRGVEVVDILQDDEKEPTVVVDLSSN